ncbi:hypothetical protein GCM10010912_05670 [Paenibacillus albidus]|uniref:N-acetyltransferase domain-containing protein n=1 Tax=Paenibacillus albidus TaxID=2041023 RepID=A0A917FD00_9BACL|nr:GNAT family N-acetyltransferase [Paenibacillus albidus]GGF63467.1 hypothetical protein GCM10010912_05670 [Paenibacillus albidus]
MNEHNSKEIQLPATSVHVVRAQLERVPEVLKLLQEAAQWMEDNGIRQWSPGQFNEADITAYFSDRQVYLALDHGQAVGMFTLQFSDPLYWGEKNDEAYAYLHRLAVTGTHRGKGLGKAMLLYAAQLALELGCKGLRFDTVAHNLKLNRYYQSLGFYYMGTNDMGGGRLVNLYQQFTDRNDPDAILLRYFSESDFAYIKSWSHSPEFLKQWAGPSLTYPLTDEQLTAYLTDSNHPVNSDKLLFTAVHAASRQIIGHISIARIDRENGSARLARVVVEPGQQGKGLGKRMVHEALRIGFDGLGLHRISLGVFDFNTAALKAYEACGFIREGAMREAALFDGTYVDCIEFSMLDREWRALRPS